VHLPIRLVRETESFFQRSLFDSRHTDVKQAVNNLDIIILKLININALCKSNSIRAGILLKIRIYLHRNGKR
jgi:hypothetical protein